jgi:hypothetical protein
MLQARRSLLVWKLFGKRLDGFANDDHPSESKPGSGDLVLRGQEVPIDKNRAKLDIDYVGSIMPPAAAVKNGKVAALTDEDRRTILRWIDLGCPIDMDYAAHRPEFASRGWTLDDTRPTLALTWPLPGRNAPSDRILLGITDYGSGLDVGSVRVTADVELAGILPGKSLGELHVLGSETYAIKFPRPIDRLKQAKLTVAVCDKQGNETKIVRSFSVE